ncbi:hypothetical protein GCM10007968_20760 [Sporolactobacillus putidus]|uniref:Uncharacterized protein n=1 Tax=Sporolactobacillus putidus TaxID=492735 RepID=A0A917W186_9BACL|nr:hypothetical protein GCM10007968_20760 [Sporolactobacillus putidus]
MQKTDLTHLLVEQKMIVYKSTVNAYIISGSMFQFKDHLYWINITLEGTCEEKSNFHIGRIGKGRDKWIGNEQEPYSLSAH